MTKPNLFQGHECVAHWPDTERRILVLKVMHLGLANRVDGETTGTMHSLIIVAVELLPKKLKATVVHSWIRINGRGMSQCEACLGEQDWMKIDYVLKS